MCLTMASPSPVPPDAGKDGVALIPLPHDRFQLILQIGCHLVECFRESANFLGVGGPQPMRQVAADKSYRVTAEVRSR